MLSEDDRSRFVDDEGEVRLTRKFTGRVPLDTPRNSDHMQGFDEAFRRALDEADRALAADLAQSPGAPKQFRTRVTFEADVEVMSPGNVREYRVIVEEL